MYIGDVGSRGLAPPRCTRLVDNSNRRRLWQATVQKSKLKLIPDNSITVEDNGRGIPTGMHEKEGRSALEVVLTVLHAGGKFSKDSYKVSGGLHGVGVSCVNALSVHLTAEVHRDGQHFIQEFERGIPLYPVKVVGDSDKRGTIITFKPDSEIFVLGTEYNYEILATRLRELAYLNKGVKLVLEDLRDNDNSEEGEASESKSRREVFHSELGLLEFVKYLDGTREKLTEKPIYLEGDKSGIPIEIAMQYNTGFTENIHSYVNNINTIEGGTRPFRFPQGTYNNSQKLRR